MTKINETVQLEVSGTQLADWWWNCDNYEQAEFFNRLKVIKARNPAAFMMQMEYLREALFGLFEQPVQEALEAETGAK